MTEYNKTSLISGALGLTVALVAFFAIIIFVDCVKCGKWWAFPVPFASIVYGTVAFVKKYKPKNTK